MLCTPTETLSLSHRLYFISLELVLQTSFTTLATTSPSSLARIKDQGCCLAHCSPKRQPHHLPPIYSWPPATSLVSTNRPIDFVITPNDEAPALRHRGRNRRHDPGLRLCHPGFPRARDNSARKGLLHVLTVERQASRRGVCAPCITQSHSLPLGGSTRGLRVLAAQSQDQSVPHGPLCPGPDAKGSSSW